MTQHGPIHFLSMFQEAFIGPRSDLVKNFPGFSQQTSLSLTDFSAQESPEKPIKVTLRNQFDPSANAIWNKENRVIDFQALAKDLLGQGIKGHSSLMVEDLRDKNTLLAYISWPESDDLEFDTNAIDDEKLLVNSATFYVSPAQYERFQTWYDHSPFAAHKNIAMTEKIKRRTILGREIFALVKDSIDIKKTDLLLYLKKRKENPSLKLNNWNNISSTNQKQISSKIAEYDEIVDQLEKLQKSSTLTDKQIHQKLDELVQYQTEVRNLLQLKPDRMLSSLTSNDAKASDVWSESPKGRQLLSSLNELESHSEELKKSKISLQDISPEFPENIEGNKSLVETKLREILGIPKAIRIKTYIKTPAFTKKLASFDLEKRAEINDLVLRHRKIRVAQIKHELIHLHKINLEETKYSFEDHLKLISLSEQFKKFNQVYKKYDDTKKILKKNSEGIKYADRFDIWGTKGYACVDVTSMCIRQLTGNRDFYERGVLPRNTQQPIDIINAKRAGAIHIGLGGKSALIFSSLAAIVASIGLISHQVIKNKRSKSLSLTTEDHASDQCPIEVKEKFISELTPIVNKIFLISEFHKSFNFFSAYEH